MGGGATDVQACSGISSAFGSMSGSAVGLGLAETGGLAMTGPGGSASAGSMLGQSGRSTSVSRQHPQPGVVVRWDPRAAVSTEVKSASGSSFGALGLSSSASSSSTGGVGVRRAASSQNIGAPHGQELNHAASSLGAMSATDPSRRVSSASIFSENTRFLGDERGSDFAPSSRSTPPATPAGERFLASMGASSSGTAGLASNGGCAQPEARSRRPPSIAGSDITATPPNPVAPLEILVLSNAAVAVEATKSRPFLDEAIGRNFNEESKPLGGSSGSALTKRDPSRPAPSADSSPPFYWVPSVDSILEFEVSGAHGELVMKIGDFEDEGWALPIAGTLRMARGGLYLWTVQIVRQCAHRPQLQFGVHGAGHAWPWRVVSSGRCSRSRDDGPWISRPGGDLSISEGDYVHCEADLRGHNGGLGNFSFAVNDGPFETAFEDLPLSDGPLHPVLLMGGDGTMCRLCSA